MSGLGTGPYWIDPYDESGGFPDINLAMKEPNGLLAVGGNLTPKRLIDAYKKGIFPWYTEGQPILWCSPDPRSVLFPDKLNISRSTIKKIRQEKYQITVDRAFKQVISQCAEPRADGNGTWLTPQMIDAYYNLHELGYAHSAECWQGDELVGGLYGVSIGRVFFGESMYSRNSDASKIAFIHLATQLKEWGYSMIDCQVHSKYLQSLGASVIPRQEYINLINHWTKLPALNKQWILDRKLIHSLIDLQRKRKQMNSLNSEAEDHESQSDIPEASNDD